MSRWVQRLLAYLAVAVLVAGGLGWATSEALELEHHRREAAAQARHTEKLRLALWRLDGQALPLIVREDSRPYAHFRALHSPIPALTHRGNIVTPGTVRVPSPLLEVEMREWMLLHFQIHPNTGWESPQVIVDDIYSLLRRPPFSMSLVNVTDDRAALLETLSKRFPHQTLIAQLQTRPGLPFASPTQEVTEGNTTNPNYSPQWSMSNTQSVNPPPQSYQPDAEQVKRNELLGRARQDGQVRGGKGVDPTLELDDITSKKQLTCTIEDVRVGSMAPLWLPTPENPEYLLLMRVAEVGAQPVLQGLIIDWPKFQRTLQSDVNDLFPEARLTPMLGDDRPHPDRTMYALSVQLDPGPVPPLPPAGWTPLRIGLCLAWAAAAIALLAVGLGGWSLIDLSERRFRFVSAVTHELRTPMTTLRLYLDMLTSGMVSDETQRDEYLRTLTGESDRLLRLVNNVLAYARLERQAARSEPAPIAVAELLDRVKTAWLERCESSGKTLVVENNLLPDARVTTDSELAQQIVGNLLDNACKYSRCAADKRVWVRAGEAGPGRVALEVEDCGPGIEPRERRSIFRAFRRGREADTTAGGVGLGLALAERWASMLGGRLDVRRGSCGGGACFRLELPV